MVKNPLWKFWSKKLNGRVKRKPHKVKQNEAKKKKPKKWKKKSQAKQTNN